MVIIIINSLFHNLSILLNQRLTSYTNQKKPNSQTSWYSKSDKPLLQVVYRFLLFIIDVMLTYFGIGYYLKISIRLLLAAFINIIGFRQEFIIENHQDISNLFGIVLSITF